MYETPVISLTGVWRKKFSFEFTFSTQHEEAFLIIFKFLTVTAAAAAINLDVLGTAQAGYYLQDQRQKCEKRNVIMVEVLSCQRCQILAAQIQSLLGNEDQLSTVLPQPVE